MSNHRAWLQNETVTILNRPLICMTGVGIGQYLIGVPDQIDRMVEIV